MSTAIAENRVQLNFKDWHAQTRIKADRPELTPEEAEAPVRQVLLREDPAARSARTYAMMDQPCDPAMAHRPGAHERPAEPGRPRRCEIGWCNLPNGAGFIANRMIYPDVTADMVDWWFAWHPLEDLRYRIWYPPQHGGIMLSPEGRKRILDPSIPNREKNWGVVHHVTENCNCGMENIDIHFLSPQDFGFDMTRWKEPYVSTFAGGFGWAVAVNKTDESITAPALMCHIFRQHPKGLEHRTRFWMGYRMSNGKPELTLPPGVKVPAEAVQGLARHNVCEFTRWGEFLPRIYKELGHSMVC